MPFNVNDFITENDIEKLPSSVGYNMNHTARTASQYSFVNGSDGYMYDRDVSNGIPVGTHRIKGLSAWSTTGVDAKAVNWELATDAWEKVIPVTFSSLVSGIPTITVSVLSRLKKMRRFASCFLLCLVCNTPAFSLSMGQNYYSTQHGTEVAIARQCGVDKAIITKALKYYLISVPSETKDIEFQLKIIEAFYQSASKKIENVSAEQCVKSKLQFLKYAELFDKHYHP